MNTRRLGAPAAIIFLLLLAFFVSTAAQTTATKDAQATGTITGRVTADGNQPAAGMSLVLMPSEFTMDRRAVARATTGADGRYKMSNVPAGRYRLQTLAPAYTSVDMRGGSFFNMGKLINVGAGETVEGVDVALTRGAVITGRVTTGDGKPVIGERLNVNVAEQRGPGQQVVNPFEFETDDRGVYRIYGLPAGRYLVSIGEDRDSGVIIVGAAGARYTRTFHPSATDVAQARVVELSAGGVATDVDIVLVEAPKSYKATGRVVDAETGRPVSDVSIAQTAIRGDAQAIGGFGWDGSKTNAEGEFVLKNLFPGRYAAFVFQMEAQSSTYSEPVQFEVVEGDVSGLVIKLRRGATVTGTAVVEGVTDRTVLSKLSSLRVFANVKPTSGQNEAGGGGGAAAFSMPAFGDNKLGADGSFRFTGLRPGKLTINIWQQPPAKGFTLLRVEHNGVEVRDGVEIGEGAQVTGVRLVLGYGAAVVRGQVELRNAGRPAVLPEGARLVAVARRVGATQGGGGSAEVDARGRFAIEGLMAGEYELTVRVVMQGPPGARFPTVKQTVQVPDSGETSVNLVYDLSKPVEGNQ